MSNNSVQRMKALFEQALKVPPDARDEWLNDACASDEDLRRQVADLLQHRDCDTIGALLRDALESGDLHDLFSVPTATRATRRDGSWATDQPPPHFHIEGYELIREIKRGGQGVVFQAVQGATKRKVAIKVLLEGAYASKSAQKRFEREIELVAQLRHPNIVSIFHSGETSDGQRFYAMDYVRGLPLTQHVRVNKLNLQATLDLFSKVCDAVQYAHQRGIIHRDLKPSNVLVDAKGEPKLLDFGLAKWVADAMDTVLSMTAAVIGTLPYMSPEQTRGNPDEIDIRTDIYALGVILYELLTGHFPYPVTQNMAETLRNIAEAPPTPPSRGWTSDSGVTARSDRKVRVGTCPIDDEVQTVMLKALAKEPNRRYQSAGDFAADLRHYLCGDAIEAKRASGWYLFRVSLRQHRWQYSTVAAFVILLSALGVSYVQALHRENAHFEERLAQEQREHRMARGLNLRSAGEYEKALEELDAYLAGDPGNPLVRLTKAQILQTLYLKNSEYDHRGTLDEALDLLDDLQESSESSKQALNLQGFLYMKVGAYDEAESTLRGVIQSDPDFFYASSNLAKLLALQGRSAEAWEVLQVGLAAARRISDPPRHADGIYRTAAILALRLGVDDPVALLDEAIAIDPEDHDNYLLLALVRLDADYRDPAKALAAAENAYLYSRLNVLTAPDLGVDRIRAMASLANDHLDDAEVNAIAASSSTVFEAYAHLMQAVVAGRQGRPELGQRFLDQADGAWPAFDAKGQVAMLEGERLWIETAGDYKALRELAVAAIAGR